jgi:hypothetical protein
VLDPIYQNKDPILASVNERKAEGAITSLVMKASVPAFFFNFKLEGEGCEAEVKGKKGATGPRASTAKGRKSEAAGGSSGKGDKDPISVSVNERKTAGSILTQVARQGPPEDLDVYKFKLAGQGA